MKTLTIILFLITFSCNEVKPTVSKSPKKEVKLEVGEIKLDRKQCNTFEVLVELGNSIKIPMILDSGASTVSLPPYIVYTLIAADKITKKDVLTPRDYVIANGDVITNNRFILRELKIGDFILKNIECSVSTSNNSSLLLGQNVLSQFKKVTVDYNRNTLILEK